MLTNSKAFSGFAAPDIDEAQRFYGETLGLSTSVENGLLMLKKPNTRMNDPSTSTDSGR